MRNQIDSLSHRVIDLTERILDQQTATNQLSEQVSDNTESITDNSNLLENTISDVNELEDNSVSVEHLKYISGEHVWFDSTFEGFITAELIWNFVSQYDINVKRKIFINHKDSSFVFLGGSFFSALFILILKKNSFVLIL